MVVIGCVSSLLSLAGYELRILMWIDAFGPEGAWGVRALLIAAGAYFYLTDQAPKRDQRSRLLGTVCADCDARITESELASSGECDRCGRPIHLGQCADHHEAWHLKRLQST